jgi:hypothetical protein
MAEYGVSSAVMSHPPTHPSQGNCQSYDISTYGNFANGSCITSPNLHARNKSDAA